MPHIQMTIEAARRHVLEKKPNMFGIPRAVALDKLKEMEAKGDVFIPTEGCPTFDSKKGCQCNDMEATEKVIMEREDFTHV